MPWRARAYNGSLGAEPPAGSRGRAPGQGAGGEAPLKLKSFQPSELKTEELGKFATLLSIL